MEHYKTLNSKSKSKLSANPEIIGFVNGWGESNCFLNSALQVLYHLIDFRTLLSTYSICQKSKSHYCITCGLKETFEIYSNRLASAKYTPIDITKLRSELAQSFAGKNLFAINEPGDSMEALCALLSSVHKDPGSICYPKCPAHSVFQLCVEESIICRCSKIKVNTWDVNTFDQHFYVNEIFEETIGTDQYALLKVKPSDFTELVSVSNAVKFDGRIQDFIKNQWALSLAKTCPKDCEIAESRKELRLLKAPKVFTVNLIWRDFNPKLNKILQILASISYSVSLDSIYISQERTVHNLKSMIIYGRGHYICAIRLGSTRLWHTIDDEKGRLTGKGTWLDLVIYCLTNRYYPVGLFYEQSNKREFTDIPSKQWIDLEKQCLDYMKNVELCQEDEDWTCKCGARNNPHWKFCSKCKTLRPGLSGWICEICTFLNTKESLLCTSCGASKKKTPTCICNKTPCVCKNKCKTCGEAFKGKCKKCFSGKFCYICSNEISVEFTKLCCFCLQVTDGNFCKNCQVEIQKNICSHCAEGLKTCRICNKYSEKKAKICSYEKCKQPFELSVTLNSKIKNRITEEENAQKKTLKWSCALCKSEHGLSDNKYCPDCFENQKKCGSCKITYFLCEVCFRDKVKCKICDFFYNRGEKCLNQDCVSNHIESSPKSIADDFIYNRWEKGLGGDFVAETTQKNGAGQELKCRMCSKKLPPYGFCLNCKLKLKGSRCSLCVVDSCRSFCESCVFYTRTCDKCRKQTHVTDKTCFSCIK